jgi:drug/metabolite transporter (DMT)-like permease
LREDQLQKVGLLEVKLQLRHILALIFLAALWGGSFLFMRIAAPVLGAVWLIALRVLLAGLMLLPLALRANLLPSIRQHWRSLLFVGCINLAVPFSLLAFASIYLPAGFTSILNATVPLFGTFVSSIWFQEKLTVNRLLGFGVGFTGVVVIVGWRSFDLTQEFLGAVGAGLVAALLYAIAAPYIKQKLAGVSSLAIATGTQFGAVVCLLPILPFTIPTQVPTPIVILSLLGLAFLSTALASLIYLRLIKEIGATSTLTVAYLIPLFAIFWGAIVLGENLTPAMAVGGGMVLLGTAISNGLLYQIQK